MSKVWELLINEIFGSRMISLKKIANIAALGCLGFCLSGLVACLEDEVPVSGGNNNGEIPVDPNTGKPMDTYEDTITYRDTITGQIITKVDTFYKPKDTTLHWVGNSALRITEIAPVNLDWLDEEGNDPGWIEIYNAGADTADLKGYTLVENRKNARKWFFGNVKVAPKGFVTVFCDKKDVKESPANTTLADGSVGHGRPHTNWKLEKDHGTVYLIDPYYGIRDTVDYPELTSGLSWGIVDGGSWKYFEKPTPEKPNTEATAYDGVAPEFNFSGSEGGFYNGQVVLNAPSTSDGLKIRCTRDGSEPTKNSQEFNQAITITQNTVLRCAAFKEGLLTNKIVTHTYFIDEVVNMPVVAVTVDPSFFDKHYIQPKAGSTNGEKPADAPSGMYDDVEFPIHVEYFADGSKTSKKSFEIEAGISLMGNYSRLEHKKSVAITMREEYQAGRLDYPLFETRKDTHHKFKGFNLRNNGNRFVSDYFEDSMGGALLEGSGVDYQRSRQVVVFYNGKYFGIHDMRERFNRHYVETNYNIDAGTVDIIKHLSTEVTGDAGAVANYKALLQYAVNNDFSGENNASYAAIKTIMDVGNFADYMIAEMYIHNGDWPNNNVRAWRSPEQTWKFMVYDLDHGFDWNWSVGGFSGEANGTNMFKWVKQGGRPESSNKCFNNKTADCFHNLYVKLMENPDFQRLFLNHAAVMFDNYVNEGNVSTVVNRMAATLVSSEVERDLEKNKQGDRYYSNVYGNGFSASGKDMIKWAGERDEVVLKEYAQEFGVSGRVSMTIAADGSGSVLMEGVKLPGSGSSYKGKFFSGMKMELTAVANSGFQFVGWSDGNIENPRMVEVTEGATFTAKFRQ